MEDDDSCESFFNPNEPWFNPVTAELIGMPETIQVEISGVVFDIPYSVLISSYFKRYPGIKHKHPVYDRQSFPEGITVHGKDGSYYVAKVNAVLEFRPYEFTFGKSSSVKMTCKNPFDCRIDDENELYYAFRRHLSKIKIAHGNVPDEYVHLVIVKFSDVPVPEPKPKPVPKPVLETRPWKERVFSLGLPEYIQIPFPESQEVLELPVEFFVRLFNTQDFVWFPSVPKELEPEYQLRKGRYLTDDYQFKMTPMETSAEIHLQRYLLRKGWYTISFSVWFFSFLKGERVVLRGSMLTDRARIGWDSVLEDVIKNPELQEL